MGLGNKISLQEAMIDSEKENEEELEKLYDKEWKLIFCRLIDFDSNELNYIKTSKKT